MTMTKTKTLHDHHSGSASAVTTVLHVGNVHWGSEKAVVESILQRLPGVLRVEANPVAQTATSRTTRAQHRSPIFGDGSRTPAITAPASPCPAMCACRCRSPIRKRYADRTPLIRPSLPSIRPATVSRRRRARRTTPWATEGTRVSRWRRRGRDPHEVAKRLSRFGRFGTPQEIADATLWLCSAASSFTTGHALAVDGGMLGT